MAPHSSTLAWKIPWMEEPGGLQSMTSLRVGHDWATSLSCIEERNGSPLQYSCLENPRDGGAWWAAIYGVAQSWTWLKWLSSSSSIYSFFLDLFLHWSPVAYWAPTDLGSSSFSILSFCLFILFMGFSRQEWFTIPFSSGPHSVRPLHHDPPILGGPTGHGLVSLS